VRISPSSGTAPGGNLAAVRDIRARDKGWRGIRLQVLVYPVTDHDFETGSYRRHGDSGLPLGRVDMQWFWDHYVPDPTDRDDPRASPLRPPDLSGLPETHRGGRGLR
jgi:acetyl esterase